METKMLNDAISIIMDAAFNIGGKIVVDTANLQYELEQRLPNEVVDHVMDNIHALIRYRSIR